MKDKAPRSDLFVVHPFFPGGGGEAVCAWSLYALSNFFNVFLLTFDDVSLSQLNKYYGTKIAENQVKIVKPTLSSLFMYKKKYSFMLLKTHILMRYCKKIKDRQVIFFSSYGEMDFGVPGIQYIHFPLFARDQYGSCEAKNGLSHVYIRASLRRIYELISYRLSGYSEEGMKCNVTLTNSYWTREIILKTYGIEARVVYPPVKLKVSTVEPWEKREDGFLCIGRLDKSKRILEVIDILRKVRDAGFGIHLHIIGPITDKKYYREILKRIKENQDWIFLEGSVTREHLSKFISTHKYGIHGMPCEHFGIAVAEMVQAGCLVFIPDGGGQVEIVDHDSRVVYKNQDDAVEKILYILENEKEQEAISAQMVRLGQRFSAERFMAEIREIVNGFCGRENRA